MIFSKWRIFSNSLLFSGKIKVIYPSDCSRSTKGLPISKPQKFIFNVIILANVSWFNHRTLWIDEFCEVAQGFSFGHFKNPVLPSKHGFFYTQIRISRKMFSIEWTLKFSIFAQFHSRMAFQILLKSKLLKRIYHAKGIVFWPCNALHLELADIA